MGPVLLPLLDDETRFFWEAGRDGVLRILRCDSCGFLSHPPYPRCPRCLGTAQSPTEMSGFAAVYTFTVVPPAPPETEPTIIAIVELDEGVRMTTNLVGVAANDVRIGMRVSVQFHRIEDVWLPVFAPADDG